MIRKILFLAFVGATFAAAQTPDQALVVKLSSGESVGYTLKSIDVLFFSGVQGKDTLNIRLSPTGFTLQYALSRVEAITFSYFEPTDSILIDLADGGVRSYALASLENLSFIDKDVTAAAERVKPTTVTSYRLEQNYPNPFNPSTTIRYYLPQPSHVRLSVSTVLGQVIGELVDEPQSAGEHRVVWNASAAPSGLYFCRLQAGAYRETRTMMLLK
jgi:hypothetical protein